MKASKTLTLIVLLSFVLYVQAGLWEDLTDYIWNWNVYMGAMGSILGCWQWGVWALFWDDDDGLCTGTCMKMYGGSKVDFSSSDMDYKVTGVEYD